MINVTKTFFPPIEDYQKQVQRIWDNQWLTNNGELYKELSEKLQEYLGVNHIIPMTNGTLPIQIALNAFANGGEVITTPFSYVATTATIVWEKCTPVFVDIHPDYLTIDETKIEAAITDKTTAILATHVYGNPCAVEDIEAIAKKYHLKVIYDAAHCFGVSYKGQSIFNYGDVSTCSFHATKLFHTGEGGALFCQDEPTKQEMWYRHNFGHDGPEKYHGLGLNAKMSELQAAMGLSVLPYMEQIMTERKRVCEYYEAHLDFSQLSKLKLREHTDWNYSYYPVIFKTEKELLNVKTRLEEENINPRRYFYPSLEELPYINSSHCPIAKDIASRVLCLPLYTTLKENDLKTIVILINHG
ncbi:DegT/DnrJ/EryC1/StrS family aminotransferase [Psychroflexus montanilacus]|uniref:DegT/DnrJ/EryC1/StrS family aminotransferase n=1 Tax=Psychroflexus montanilacus TaxID=2873598 RepID=UPI001CCAEF11|nr:DegT/DnrJ/EryC1/StrS family aminotransferase [Psychroflexus montanilacus]MBZ9652105.1 DegT/DnrJ/EryC1/StrS family aminotransferase [Psychroflexus montanilacus]